MARRRRGGRSGLFSGAIRLRGRRTRSGGGGTILPPSRAAGRTWRFRFLEAEMTEERKKLLDHKGRIIRAGTHVKARMCRQKILEEDLYRPKRLRQIES